MAKKRRKGLGNARVAKPQIAPYGRAMGAAMPYPTPKGRQARTETMCTAVAPDRAVRLCLERRRASGPSIAGPAVACSYLRSAGKRDRESFYAVLLDAQNRVIGVDEVAKGSLTDVEVHPREVFKSAIISNAAGILVGHNHPSGNTEPSKQDMALTEKLIEAGNMLGIPVRDHVILGDETCTSVREMRPHMGFKGWEKWHRRRTRGA